MPVVPEDVMCSFDSLQGFITFIFWVEEMEMCGLPFILQLFTNEELDEQYLKLMPPPMSYPLKSEKEWFKFWEKLKNLYVGQVHGNAKTPFSYSICNNEAVLTSVMRGQQYYGSQHCIL